MAININHQTDTLTATGASGSFSGFSLPSSVDYQEFTSSGTWTKPAGVSIVYIEAIGSGAGGASGGRRPAGVISRGGSGGSSGLRVRRLMQASDLASTVYVTVGAGGAGGPARTTDNVDGQSSSSGNYCSFGSHLTTGRTEYSRYSNPGLVPWNIPSGSTTVGYEANRGAYSNSGGNAGSAGFNTMYGPAGGGAGGGITSGDVGNNGGNGGGGFDVLFGGVGTLGDDNIAGDGGAGGVSGTSGTNGSVGSDPGDGGGGGGASRNGYNSGKGGNGANGVVRIWSW